MFRQTWHIREIGKTYIACKRSNEAQYIDCRPESIGHVTKKRDKARNDKE